MLPYENQQGGADNLDENQQGGADNLDKKVKLYAPL